MYSWLFVNHRTSFRKKICFGGGGAADTFSFRVSGDFFMNAGDNREHRCLTPISCLPLRTKMEIPLINILFLLDLSVCSPAPGLLKFFCTVTFCIEISHQYLYLGLRNTTSALDT